MHDLDDLDEIALAAHALRTATRREDVVALLADLEQGVDRLRETHGLDPVRATASGDLVALASAAQAAVHSDCLPSEVHAKLSEAVDRIHATPLPRPSAPGAWHIRVIGREPFVFADDGSAVAVVCADGKGRRHRGHESLICAAPAMREALRAIRGTYAPLLTSRDFADLLGVLRLADGGGA